MILQSLYHLYDRLSQDPDYRIARFGYSLQRISFRVVITPEGELCDIQDARDHSQRRARSQQMMVPGGTKKSGSGLNPCFLCDNTGYMLGYKPGDSRDSARAGKTFEAFRDKHVQLENEIGSPAFSAVCRFLRDWNLGKAARYPQLAELSTGFGVFQIRGEQSYVHEDPKVVAWWERRGTSGHDEPMTQCLVSGENGVIARTHPKIKGVGGRQSSGAAIVSFNERAYDSYGKEQSFNAPVSEAATFRYTTALNALLDGPMKLKHRLPIGDATVLFWTEKPSATEDIFVPFAENGSRAVEADQVQDEALRKKLEVFLTALRKGREAYVDMEGDADRTRFFLLGLSPNAGRISVRFFHRSTLADLLTQLRRHYRDIAIGPQPARGGRRADPEFPPARMLLRETAREWKEVPPILAGPLLRAIVTGVHYPTGLYEAIIRRIHADRAVNYARACAIKGFLTRNLGKEISMTLDKERIDFAYRMGRLFAALEKTQLDGLGRNLNTTIRDGFYSSASATPRSVFPRLLRTYQHHLARMEGGFKVNRERLVQEILGPVEDFPAHLDLAGQGLFALGYYHQMQAFYARRNQETQISEKGEVYESL